MIKSNIIHTSDDNYFFGYYDVQAFDNSEKKYLCLFVPFVDRLPSASDSARICVIENDNAQKVADTHSWNFQQGCFLQWLPGSDNEIIYNDFNGKRNIAIIRNIETGARRIVGMPVANVSPDGVHALSFNFSRLHDYRPGYGYANLPDPFRDIDIPDNDGIFLIDLRTGESRLLISYKRLWEMFNKNTEYEKRKLVINHVNFNTDGSKFVFLLRCFVDSPPSITLAGISDLNAENITSLIDYGMASHYHWKDPESLIIYARIDKKDGLYEINTNTREYQEIDPVFFVEDGHCSYSPCKRYLLYDSYPINNYRNLFLYDLQERVGVDIGQYFTNDAQKPVDCRCDLHPRWSPTGRYITFDSVHEGHRGIYLVDTQDAIKYLRNYYSLTNKMFRIVKKNLIRANLYDNSK